MSNNEQENDNCDSVADIVAEMHREANELCEYGTHCVGNYADRIEAAWKRQEQCYLDQIRDAVNMIGHERFVAKHPPVGNAAAIREALTEIRDTMMNGGFDGRSPAHFVNICDAALSAPARNCDLYDNKTDAETRFVEETGENDMAQHYWQMFAIWLFAPAAERKGDGDEQK